MSSDPSANEAAVEISQHLQEAGRLAPGLIHELRHPVTAIKAGLQLLRQSAPPEEGDSEEWQLVRGQVSRLEELLDTYQDFLHSDRTRPEQLELRSVVQRALTLVAYRTRALGTAFQTSLPERPIHVFSNRAAITHALINVVVNALDALESMGAEGLGRRLSLRVLPPSESSGPQIRIADEGPGIPGEHVNRIFESNFSTKSRDGSGHGLKVARRLLTAAGTQIALTPPDDADREPWASTEFMIQFPKRSPTHASEKDASAAPTEKTQRSRVLVVDDEEVILKLIRIGLDATGLRGRHRTHRRCRDGAADAAAFRRGAHR